MELIPLIEQIPPAFYGIIIGSFLTIIGVVLTNMSNTKRLKLQHEHERDLRNKERDLNMRREVYMDAMEAISVGITAISRFSDLHESPEALMQSYSSMSSKESRVMIVGTNETINALANFNVELNGAFLRLSAKRDKFDAVLEKSQQLEKEITQIKQRMEDTSSQLDIDSPHVSQGDEQSHLRAEYQKLDAKQSDLQSENEALGNQLMSLVEALVLDSISEVGTLNQLLVPIVACMRAELELPFDEDFYINVLSKGHEKLNEHLASFFDNNEAGMPDSL